MSLPLDRSVPRIRFVIVKALGTSASSFGSSVAERLQEFLSVLPEGVQLAVCVDREQPTPDLGASLRALRTRLVTLENIRGIEELGFTVEGTEASRYKVLHILVSALQDVTAEAFNTLGPLLNDYPADGFIHLCQVDPGEKAIENATSRMFPGTLCLVSPVAASGVSVGSEQMVTESAGTILLSLLPDFSVRLDDSVSLDNIFFAGFSGYYGIAGPALDRLSQLAGSAVIGAHLAEEKSALGGELPDSARDFLDDYSPKNLAMLLFDPSKVMNADVQAIPFRPTWKGTMFLARGGTGTPDLRLRETPEGQWSARIREFSHAFEMTLGVRWNRQLQAASMTVRREVEEHFQGRFSGLLESLVRSPYHLERLMKALEERIREKRTSQPPPSTDLGGALEEMDRAIAERPNGILLSARLALWLIPALAIGTGLLFSMYPAARATLISAAVVVAGLASGAGHVILQVSRADKRVTRSKEKALAAMVERQECIVAVNALGYLEEVVGVVGTCLDQAREQLRKYRKAFENGKKSIDEATRMDIPDHPPFSPLLTDASHYSTVFEGMGIDADFWLKEALAEKVMSEPSEEHTEGEAHAGKLVAWCKARLGKGAGVKLPSFRELFDMYTGGVAASGNKPLEKVVDNLYRWAEPLAYANRGTERSSLVVPIELLSPVLDFLQSGENTPFAKKDVVEAGTLQMFCCSRIRVFKTTEEEGG